jgi:hypothetical protein
VSKRRGGLAQLLDEEQILSLAKAFDFDGVGGYVKVPIASPWVAAVMYSEGESFNKIARAVRVDVSTVRDWITLGRHHNGRRAVVRAAA